MTNKDVNTMLMVGWLTFMLSWIINIVYLKIHPSVVDFGSIREKFQIYLCGHKGKDCDKIYLCNVLTTNKANYGNKNFYDKVYSMTYS